MMEKPDQIRQKTFSVVRRGYDRAEVSEYLAHVATNLRTLDVLEMRRKTFNTARRGFDPGEVDTYLNMLAGEHSEILEQLDAEEAAMPAPEPVDEGFGAELDAVFDTPAAVAEPAEAPAAEPAGIEPPSEDDFALGALETSAEMEPEPVMAEPEPVVAEPEPEPLVAEPQPEPVAIAPEPEPVAAEPEPVAAAPESRIELPASLLEGPEPWFEMDDLPEPSPDGLTLVEDGFQNAASEVAALMARAHASAVR